jgi:putative peptide zinc metalloprotease protein
VTPPEPLVARDDSAVLLHSLRVRRDGEEWIVGRAETGTFIAIPQVGMDVIESIQRGRSLDDVRREVGSNDVTAFVNQLIDLGLVVAVDGRDIAQPEVEKPSLPWLRPRHVRWTLSSVPFVSMAVLVLAALGVIAWDPGVFPSYRKLFWSDHQGLVLLGQVLVAWTLILIHESAHLATARAADVPARIRLGTRLQFLVAQTDVSGIWTASRRQRLTVYCAGMALDVTIASLALLTTEALRATGIGPPPILAIVVLTVSSMVPLQFLVFMRTDVYFLLQDLMKCRNLYGDGSAYVRDLAVRLFRRRGGTGSAALARLPRHERTAVRCYAALLVLGTSACVAVAATVAIPTGVRLVVDSARTLAAAASPGAMAEAALVIVLTLGSQVTWIFAWWRRHGGRVRRWVRRSAGRGEE